MTDELPEGAAASGSDLASASTARARPPGSVTAAAVLLLSFGMLAALGTAFALLGTLASSMRRLSQVMPHQIRYPMQFPMDGPMTGPMDAPGGKFGDAMVGLHMVPDGGYVLIFGLISLLLVGLIGGAIAGAHIAAGLAILQRRAWGRVLGMAGSGAALVFLVMGLVAALVWASFAMSAGPWDEVPRHMGGDFRSMMTAVVAYGTVVTLLMIGAYAFILAALARHGDAFD